MIIVAIYMSTQYLIFANQPIKLFFSSVLKSVYVKYKEETQRRTIGGNSSEGKYPQIFHYKANVSVLAWISPAVTPTYL